MSNDHDQHDSFDPVLAAASEWMLKCDRGLTPREQDALSSWLAASPRHREAFAQCRWGWEEFDRLAGLSEVRARPADPDLLAHASTPPRRQARWLWPLAASIAVAGILTGIGMGLWRTDASRGVRPDPIAITRVEQRMLDDGSRLEIDRGASVAVDFARDVRRVRLLQGQANFQVAKDPSRPFIVEVGSVAVQAVGTAFSVQRGTGDVAVVVSEGVVAIGTDSGPAADHRGGTLLHPGDKGVVSLSEPGGAVRVTQLSREQLDEAELWRPRLLDFDSVPLEQIVAEFNRRNPLQIHLADSAIASRQLSLSFWSDNVEGFVRLLESSFGIAVEWRGASEVVLTGKGGRARG